MASQPQPAPQGPVPVPPPNHLCTECELPGGGFIVTTILDCQAQGGTVVGEPFPCDQADARRQQLKDKGKLA